MKYENMRARCSELLFLYFDKEKTTNTKMIRKCVKNVAFILKCNKNNNNTFLFVNRCFFSYTVVKQTSVSNSTDNICKVNFIYSA